MATLERKINLNIRLYSFYELWKATPNGEGGVSVGVATGVRLLCELLPV